MAFVGVGLGDDLKKHRLSRKNKVKEISTAN